MFRVRIIGYLRNSSINVLHHERLVRKKSTDSDVQQGQIGGAWEGGLPKLTPSICTAELKMMCIHYIQRAPNGPVGLQHKFAPIYSVLNGPVQAWLLTRVVHRARTLLFMPPPRALCTEQIHLHSQYNSRQSMKGLYGSCSLLNRTGRTVWAFSHPQHFAVCLSGTFSSLVGCVFFFFFPLL